MYGCGIAEYDFEGRVIRADYGDTSVISVYHPSGGSGDERQAFKMKWLSDFQKYIKELEKSRPKLIISGDYNICHKAIDIHNPVSNANTSGFYEKSANGWSNLFNRVLLIHSGTLIKSLINIVGGVIEQVQGVRIWAGALIIIWLQKTWKII